MEREVYPVSSKAPIIGRRIFTTQAGLHQTGVQKQQDAPGGLIYLPYAAALVGREDAELNLVGSLSGMDGLVAILNNEMKAAGEEKRYSLYSKTVKEVYDRVHAAFDGKWDEEAGKYVDHHVSFFEPSHLLAMVRELEKESENGNSL
jgi:isopropylmalate/homocitrate/citramalate synthase